MMKIFLIFLGILFVIIGCRENKKNINKNTLLKNITIDFSDSDLKKEGAVFTEFEFVKLETTKESLLSGILKVIVADSKYFILSALGGEVMIFDKHGKFKFKLEKGRAPQEVIYPTDIAVSEGKHELYVFDRYRTVKVFDLQGKHIKSIGYDDVALYIETVGEQLVFFDSNFDGKKEYYGQIKDGDEVVTSFFPKRGNKLLTQKNMIYPYPFFKSGKDTVFVSCLFSDTVYMVCDNGYRITPYYFLDSYGKSMNQSKYFNKVSGFGEYLDACRNKNYASGTSNFVKQKDKLFFNITEGKDYFVVYDLLTDRATLFTKLIEGLPNIYSKVGGNNEYIIYAMTASWLYDHFKCNLEQQSDSDSLKKLRQTVVSDEDNPILLLCKIGI